MRLKTIHARTMQEAMELVREQMGAEAIIVAVRVPRVRACCHLIGIGDPVVVLERGEGCRPFSSAVVARAVQMTVKGVVGWYRQTLDGSFSSVSRPIFASK